MKAVQIYQGTDGRYYLMEAVIGVYPYSTATWMITAFSVLIKERRREMP